MQHALPPTSLMPPGRTAGAGGRILGRRPLGLLVVMLSVGPIVPASAGSGRPWNIDFFQGPLVNSQRMVGLGGAFVGVADGVEGHLTNPASFAVRSPFFGNTWFDWDLGTAAYTVLGDTDYDLSGRRGRLDGVLSQQIGFNLKFGRFGAGFHALGQTFERRSPQGDGSIRSFTWSQSFGGLGLAWAFRDGEFTVGTLLGVGQARIAAGGGGAAGAASAADRSGSRDAVDYASPAYPTTFGLLYAPRGLPYRLGMAWRLPVRMTRESAETWGGEAVAQLAGRAVPDEVRMGAQFDLGVSWMFGPRRYNIRPSYGAAPLPKGAREAASIRRRYVLVSGAISVTGPVDDGVGAAAYLEGERQDSGALSVFSLRAGAESEFVANRLVVRGGSYLEPSRFRRGSRLHVTAGADLRVTVHWDWRLTFAIDLASAYRNTALGLGLWH